LYPKGSGIGRGSFADTSAAPSRENVKECLPGWWSVPTVGAGFTLPLVRTLTASRTTTSAQIGICSAHYIREHIRRDAVLERIRVVTDFICSDVGAFQEERLMCQREEQEKAIRKDKRWPEKVKKRLMDINKFVIRTL